MNHLLPILLAEGWGDALKALVPLIFLAIWIFSQLVEAKKQAPAEVKEKPRPQPKRPPGKVPAGAPLGEAAVPAGKPAGDGVRAEVEEFLRRVRQQGEEEQRPERAAEPARRPRIEVLVDETPEEVARPPVPAPRLPPLTPRKAQAPTTELRDSSPMAPLVLEPIPLRGRHLADSSVADGARQIGGNFGTEFGQADQRLEDRIHQKFDQNLGQLSSREAMPAEQVAVALATTPASDIAALLATPQGMQQAIVLGEILRRPTDRW